MCKASVLWKCAPCLRPQSLALGGDVGRLKGTHGAPTKCSKPRKACLKGAEHSTPPKPGVSVPGARETPRASQMSKYINGLGVC